MGAGFSRGPFFGGGDCRAGKTNLATESIKDYEGKELIVVGVLKGSLMFMADLIREIKVPPAL